MHGDRIRAGTTLRTFAWLLLGAALLAGWLLHWRGQAAERAAHPIVHGELRVAGPGEPIQISRDRWGIPHVSAESEADAYFGLGFVHGQDRPLQLLWWREAARGRLAEWAGAEVLAEDRLARWLSLAARAKAHFGQLSAPNRRWLESYAAGVNAAWAKLAERRPEYFPDHQRPPELWQGSDCLAIQTLYAWTLGATVEETVVLSALLEKFGGLESKVFFPDRITEKEDAVAFRAPDIPVLGVPWRQLGSLRRVLGMRGASVGSTAVVIGKPASGTGGPLLAGDAHFEPTQPGAVYAAHLRGPDFSVAGMTLPGLPAFLSGWNRDVAWAATYPGVVLTDVYVETLHPDRPDRYHDGNGWRALSVEEETIAIRGEDPAQQQVRQTRHGPLLNDLLEETLEPLAVSWLGAGEGDGLDGFFRLARARSREELQAALSRHRQPVLRFTWASRDGDFATQLAGAIPDRGQNSQLLPFPGRDREYDWRGRIEPAESASADPELSFSVAADGRSPAEARVEWLWQTGARRERLVTLIEEASRKGPIALEDLLAIQNDVVSPRSRRIVELVARVVGAGEGLPPETRECLRVLKAWEGAFSEASRGAPLFQRFQAEWLARTLVPAVGDELLARYLALRHASAEQVMERVLGSAVGEHDPLEWIDASTIRDATAASLRDAWIGLAVELGRSREKWTWGRLTQLYFHSLWPRPALDGVLGPFAYAGGRDTIRVAGVSADSVSGFAQVGLVASFRFATDASDTSQAVAAWAPGQSEHFEHPRADDAVRGWLRGDTHLFTTHPLVEEAVAEHELRLVPGS